MDNSSGVGVLDKAVALMDVAAAAPASLADLTERTGIPRPTAHRLAVALERHGLLARDGSGRFFVGPRVRQLARQAPDPLLTAAESVLPALRDEVGESAQVYQVDGQGRRCVAAAERASGLRDTVPVGSLLPMSAGSAAQALLAWEPAEVVDGLRVDFAWPAGTLVVVREQGWAHSESEREPGVASVSAPVRNADGRVVAAVSVSGPADRVGHRHAARLAPAVVKAAERLEAAVDLIR